MASSEAGRMPAENERKANPVALMKSISSFLSEKIIKIHSGGILPLINQVGYLSEA